MLQYHRSASTPSEFPVREEKKKNENNHVEEKKNSTATTEATTRVRRASSGKEMAQPRTNTFALQVKASRRPGVISSTLQYSQNRQRRRRRRLRRAINDPNEWIWIFLSVSRLFFSFCFFRPYFLYFIFSATYMYCVCLFNFAARVLKRMNKFFGISSVWIVWRALIQFDCCFRTFSIAFARFLLLTILLSLNVFRNFVSASLYYYYYRNRIDFRANFRYGAFFFNTWSICIYSIYLIVRKYRKNVDFHLITDWIGFLCCFQFAWRRSFFRFN